MKLPTFVLAACLAGAMATTSASAAPTSSRAAIAGQTSGIELVQYKRDRGFKQRKFNRNRHYDGRHYRGRDRYRGWNRYRHRPHGWRERGCVILGPIWYCP